MMSGKGVLLFEVESILALEWIVGLPLILLIVERGNKLHDLIQINTFTIFILILLLACLLVFWTSEEVTWNSPIISLLITIPLVVMMIVVLTL
jgi:hypothetical protein